MTGREDKLRRPSSRVAVENGKKNVNSESSKRKKRKASLLPLTIRSLKGNTSTRSFGTRNESSRNFEFVK